MKPFRSLCLALLALAFTLSASAADPAGSWKWTIAPPNGDPVEVSLTLEMKEGKLSGTYRSPFGEAKISNATLKADAIAFDVERDMNGTKFTIKYTGKLEGDTIKGNAEVSGFGDQGTKMEWVAKRTK
jgi:hypothetical protein